jgi:glyoxylase-like metal-dependent hydrolase (beta-lactamase superfamily II)
VVVGDFEVDALLDAEGSFATYAGAFPEAGEDEWAPWRERHPQLFDGERWRLPFRSYLIRGGGRTILVDTGVGPPGGEWLPERQGWLPGELERLGVWPDTVFLTHVHIDHVGWNSAFDAVPFVTHRDSVALSEERRRPLSPGTTAVEGEAELAPGVVAFETPGHLPGHMSIRIGEELVILGDVSVHPAQFTRPSLVYVSDDAAEPSARTREEVVSAYGDRMLACGHFPGSGFGRMLDGIWTPVA